jgi:hypothetical protein
MNIEDTMEDEAYQVSAMGLMNCMDNIQRIAGELADIRYRVLLASALDANETCQDKILNMMNLEKEARRIFEVWSFFIRNPACYMHSWAKMEDNLEENEKYGKFALSHNVEERRQAADFMEGFVRSWKKEEGLLGKEN